MSWYRSRNSAIAAAFAVAALSGPGLAPIAAAQTGAAPDEGALFILRVSGARSWQVECDFERDRGRDSSARERGRGSQASGALVGRDVVAASCEVDAGPSGDLSVTLDDTQGAFACPFQETVEGFCRGVFAAGTTATFDVALR